MRNARNNGLMGYDSFKKYGTRVAANVINLSNFTTIKKARMHSNYASSLFFMMR
jgi:hypothetical protein